jgi:hypothetical protein
MGQRVTKLPCHDLTFCTWGNMTTAPRCPSLRADEAVYVGINQPAPAVRDRAPSVADAAASRRIERVA